MIVVAAGAAAATAIYDHFGPVFSEGHVISATPGSVAVIDGDTLRLDGTVVHLKGVEAPPRGQSCAAGPDCGGQATAELADLVRDRRLDCLIAGRDRTGRPAVQCDADGRDVNLTLISDGWARASSEAMAPAETDARTHRRGIWLSH